MTKRYVHPRIDGAPGRRLSTRNNTPVIVLVGENALEFIEKATSNDNPGTVGKAGPCIATTTVGIMGYENEVGMMALHRRGMNSTLPFVAALLSLAMGCEGEGGSPTDPGAGTANVRGTYSAASMWSLTLRNSNDETVTLGCPGTLIVDQQAAGSFSGSFAVQASVDCPASSGSVVNGAVNPDASVTFQLQPTGSDSVFGVMTGCAVVSADETFRGTIVEGRIQANAAAMVDCPTFGVLALDVRVDGSR